MSKKKSTIAWASKPIVVLITKEQENFIRKDMIDLGIMALSAYIRGLVHSRMKSIAMNETKIEFVNKKINE